MTPFLLIFLLNGDITALYNSLQPDSVTQHLAFYELYPDSEEGKKAVQEAATLIGTTPEKLFPCIRPFLKMIYKKGADAFPSAETKEKMAELAAHLPNRVLKGFQLSKESELQKLIKNEDSKELDLARALLLLQQADINTYETMLDCLAMQLSAKLPQKASFSEKIEAINHLLFFELGIRFPPHGASNSSIDTYTDLPSILDSRRGVCLGVSTIYLSLAQRLELPLEIITPPGHIYLSCEGTNIETTARGIHIPSEEYLGINDKSLKKRTLSQVLGMVLINSGSLALSQSNWKKASELYEKATFYMPEDQMLYTFYGCSKYLEGKTTEAEQLLTKATHLANPDVICQDTMAKDILQKKASKEILQALFISTDGSRKATLLQKEALEKAIASKPFFRAALLQVAGCYIDLHNYNQAIVYLQKYHAIDSGNITVEYLLCSLFLEKGDYLQAQKHYTYAEAISLKAGHTPKAITELKKALLFFSE